MAELPSTGADDTIYLVPITPDIEGNNYAEYIYINGQWELLGKIGVQVDLTGYYTKEETNTLLSNKVGFTDYATSSKGGVIQVDNVYGIQVESGSLRGNPRTYAQYTSAGDKLIISKGTLENVITGKGLVSNTDYATSSTGGVLHANVNGFLVSSSSGNPSASEYTYSQYTSLPNYYFISKKTLDNVLTATIGDISSVIDLINGEVI